MSAPAPPKIAITFDKGLGTEVIPPQSDVIDLIVHLGCTKEVSSFELLLQNWAGQYSVVAKTPVTVGMTAEIGVGRHNNAPVQLTGRIEEIECRDYAEEDRTEVHFIIVKGRCLGRQLFGKLVTKAYEAQKGEAIVRDVIDSFTSLSHLRVNSLLTGIAGVGQKIVLVTDGSIFSSGDLVKLEDDANWEYNEIDTVVVNTLTMVNDLVHTYWVAGNAKCWLDLIEKTDTTFTKLYYADTPCFDIVKFVAANSDKAGTIGFDFRVEYDGKFAFFQKETKTSPVSSNDLLSMSYFKRSASRIKNKITVRGAAESRHPGGWLSTAGTSFGEWNYFYNDLDATEYTEAGNAYVVKATHTRSSPLLRRTQMFEVKCDVSFQGVGTGGYYKITYQKEGEAETVIVTDQFFDAAGYATKTHIFEMESDYEKDLTVRFYIKVHDTGTAYIKNCRWDWTQPFGYVLTDGTLLMDGGAGYQYYPNTSEDGNPYTIRAERNSTSMYVGYQYDVAFKGHKTLRLAFFIEIAAAPVIDHLDVIIHAPDGSNYFYKRLTGNDVIENAWVDKVMRLGVGEEWQKVGSPDWDQMKACYLLLTPSASASMGIWVDDLRFAERRWEDIEEDAASQSSYGVRELVVIDEELHSDAECDLRAKAILAYRKDAFDYVIAHSDLMDYGTDHMHAGDKINHEQPNLNVDEDLRIGSFEIRASGTEQTLHMRMALGKETPQLADYLFALKLRSRKSARYKAEGP